MLLNLISNAVRHTAAGRAISVCVEANGDTVTLEVADSGEGIDPALLPTLFDRFTRADAARGRATGGTGLGLAICRAIVEAHGGTISAASAPGHGATFTVELPRMAIAGPAEAMRTVDTRLTPSSPPLRTVGDDAARPRRPRL